MNVDASIPGWVVLQPESGLAQSIPHVLQDRLKGRSTGPRDRGRTILAYFTAGIPVYPALDEQLQEAADHWKDIGYRALVVTWRE